LSSTAQPTAAPPKPDFFISYAHEDREWAEWIAWQLEAAHYTTVLQAWDFHPGGNFVLTMQEELAAASRMIAVLSPSYLASAFTASEWASFFAQDPTGRSEKLVPVKVRPCQPTGLLSTIIYVDLVDHDREVAKNTLLNGVRPGRAKPASSPEFPGRGGQPVSVQAPAIEAAPPRPEASFPGPSTTPPEAGSSNFSLEYSVDIPAEIAGAEAASIPLSFTLLGGGNRITLEFEQDAFEIYDESRPNAGVERNRFQFDYPHPGKFHEKLKICAKDKAGNNRVSVTCTDASGKRWGQNTKNVRISKAPSSWETIRFGLALVLGPIRRRPIPSAVVALVLLAGWAVRWRINASPDSLRKVVLSVPWLSPVDYFKSPTAQWIQDSFLDGEKMKQDWRRSSAEWRPVNLKRSELVIKNGGYAMLQKPPFYDFEAAFNVKLLSQEQTVTWAFRVWPQGPGSDILKSHGYRFRMSVLRGNSSDGTTVQLSGFKCKQIGDKYCPTFSDPVSEMNAPWCNDDPTFHVTARAEGALFKFKIDVLHDDPAACNPQPIGAAEFNDQSPWWSVPFFWGGIVFLDAQVVQSVGVQPLNWEEKEKHSESEPHSESRPSR
jgi:hypothetical protein